MLIFSSIYMCSRKFDPPQICIFEPTLPELCIHVLIYHVRDAFAK